MTEYGDMRHECDADGCYLKTTKCRIEGFKGLFPRKISFGDIDGMVELNNHFLFLEWKGNGASMPYGQFKALERLTLSSERIWILIVTGNPQTLDAVSAMTIHNGIIGPDVMTTKEIVFDWVDWWVRHVENQPRWRSA